MKNQFVIFLWYLNLLSLPFFCWHLYLMFKQQEQLKNEWIVYTILCCFHDNVLLSIKKQFKRVRHTYSTYFIFFKH